LVPGVLEAFAEEEPMRRLAARYGEVSPDGEAHYPEVAAKVLAMSEGQPTLTADDLSAITARTLVLAADDDAMTLEHTIALYRAIPNSELSIVPGTSHLLVVEKPDEVYRQVGAFLTSEPPRTMQPFRRA
jgi:pimeloyl-ACP methyl ester carboxylesterase